MKLKKKLCMFIAALMLMLGVYVAAPRAEAKEAYMITVENGYAYVVDGQGSRIVESAEPGQIVCVGRYAIYGAYVTGFTSDDAEIKKEDDWYFVMPNHDVNVKSVTEKAEPAEFSFVNRKAIIPIELFSSMPIKSISISSTGDLWDLNFDNIADVAVHYNGTYGLNMCCLEQLDTWSIPGYEYTEMNNPGHGKYYPVTMHFNGAVPISNINLTVDLPHVGDANDYYTPVPVTAPTGSNYRAEKGGRWYVASGLGYGLAPDVFESGRDYYLETSVDVNSPKYYFPLDATVTINGKPGKVIYRYYSEGVASSVSLASSSFMSLPKAGWYHNRNGWWYVKEDGTCAVSEWLCISGKWYWFNEKGYMHVGWLARGGKWYYLNPSGYMQTGWKLIDRKWYFFSPNGVMQTGWRQIQGKWYFFNSNGAMQTEWRLINGKWYYFGTDGAMVSNTTLKIGGKTYRFDANGVCLNP